jgi:hypothetical protein
VFTVGAAVGIHSPKEAKEMTMCNPLGRLLVWVAELVDRSLIAVPDVDLPMPATAGSATALSRNRGMPSPLDRACGRIPSDPLRR